MLFTSSTSEAPASVSAAVEFAQAAPIRADAPAAPQSIRTPRDEAALADVLRHPGIWRRGTGARPAVDIEPSGIAELDARLPGGGWPRGALTEILIEQDGIGECSLVLPALAALTQAKKRIVFVAPPYIPYAPALVAAGIDLSQVVHIDANAADTHWTAEQCLRAGCCGAVLNWLPTADYRQLRRLQLAAETGAAIGFVFRPLRAAKETSPAALRLQVSVRESGPRIDILKCRGLQRYEGVPMRTSREADARVVA
jgi:hypothetical protein